MTFETSGDELTQEKLDGALRHGCKQIGGMFLIMCFDKVKTTVQFLLEHAIRHIHGKEKLGSHSKSSVMLSNY